MERFELAAEGSQTSRIGRRIGRSIDRFAAGVGNTVQTGLDSAAPDGEVDGAVGVNDQVGQRQRNPADELLRHGAIGGPVGLEVHRIEFPVTPVADVERPLVFRRELRPVAETDTGRRPGSDVDRGRERVGVVGGPFSAAVAPPEVRSTGRQADASRSIPGRVDIPFHVGVIGEPVAVAVARDIVLVAETERDQFPLFSVGRDPADEAALSRCAFHEPAAVRSRKEQVFVPVPWYTRCGQLGEFRVVAADDDQSLAVARLEHGMRAVLAAASQCAQERDMVELSIAVAVGDSIEPAGVLLPAVDHHIEAVERPQQALCLANIDPDRLDLDRRPAPDRRNLDVEQSAVLVAHDEPSVGGRAHADP